MKYNIYLLKHKEEIRYVGITKQSIKARFQQHISRSKKYSHTYKHRWIRSVDYNVTVELFCQTNNPEDEKWIIREFLKDGHRLTNTYESSYSAQAHKKISEKLKGKAKSSFHKEKLRAANLGKKQSEETKKKRYIKVIQRDKQGRIVKRFKSISAANIAMGKPCKSPHISSCAKKQLKTAYGFIWTFEDIV